MLSKYSIRFLKFATWLATRRPVPERYSLSHNYEIKYNFTHFAFCEKGFEETRFLVKEPPTGKGLIGIGWPVENEPGRELCVSYNSISNPEYDIQRIYGPVSVKYDGPLPYIWGELTAKHRRRFWRERREQRAFEQNFRFTAERMDLLAKLVDWRRKAFATEHLFRFENQGFSHIDAYSEIYSIRAWGLSNRDSYLAELRFLLESLVASGDLKYSNHQFFLESKALETLSKFEEDNRRQQSSAAHNRAIRWLTMVLAVASIIQAMVAYYSLS